MEYISFDEFLKKITPQDDVPINNESYLRSRDFAKYLDANDQIAKLRNDFYVPKSRTLPLTDLSLIESPDEESVYLCGNSLGILPKATEEIMSIHMKKWAEMGVYGHFAEPYPWVKAEEFCLDQVAALVGANSVDEVCLANGLTVNIHLLLTTFYKPTTNRHKILIEMKAFPSDHYAVESQIRMRGGLPEESLICMQPREGEDILRTEDILALLVRNGDEIALVFFSSIQFYTGQFFEMEKITKAAHEKGCIVGWDCAHSFANVPMKLHDWNVDFACWCTYKYANTGAGGIAGLFVHSRLHPIVHSEQRLLQGWWGHKLETRFQMTNKMELDPSAKAFRLSCTPFMLAAAMQGSMKVFEKTSIEILRQKSIFLTSYLERLIDQRFSEKFSCNSLPRVTIITPRDPIQRGCQLSLKFDGDGRAIFGELMRRGVAVDFRYPNVIRVAPVHLYNSFEDCWRFVDRLTASAYAVHTGNASNIASKYH